MGIVSSLINYAPQIELDYSKKGGATSRLKIQNIEQSIAFKTERELRFYNKRNFVPLKAKNNEGKLVTVYVNINSLAKRVGLSKAAITAESKAGHLEALVQSRAYGSSLEIEKAEQRKDQEGLKLKFGRILHLDPFLTDPMVQKMGKMVLHLETSLEKDGRTYLETLRERYLKGGKPLLLRKGSGNFPYSIEYHGPSATGSPILYVKYDPNFAEGGMKKVTKALDFVSERVLVKSKVLSQENFEAELQGHTNMKGVSGTLNLLHCLHYSKGGKARLALYTDFKNRGDLHGVKGNFQGKNREEILLLGLYHMLGTLKELHAKGIVHHDVKASNIFVAQNLQGQYQFYLGDPGLSKEVNEPFSYLSGTLRSPEQHGLYWNNVEDEMEYRNLSEKVDIFTLGLTWRSLLGNPTEDLNPILTKMLLFDPINRISASQAQEELGQILARRGINPDNNAHVAKANI